LNGKLEELEDQLRHFRPADVSTELRQRIARDLEELDQSKATVAESSHRPTFSLVWLAVATAATVLLAIGVVAGLRLLDRQYGSIAKHSEQTPVEDIRDIQPKMPLPARGAKPSLPPTFLAYRLASADSVDGLNMLLDRHARVLLSPSADGDLAGIGFP
jgi:hypothetical protein